MSVYSKQNQKKKIRRNGNLSVVVRVKNKSITINRNIQIVFE